jgi:hypothetical protein
MGWHHPLAVAACASIAGHLGSALMMQFLVAWLKRRVRDE